MVVRAAVPGVARVAVPVLATGEVVPCRAEGEGELRTLDAAPGRVTPKREALRAAGVGVDVAEVCADPVRLAAVVGVREVPLVGDRAVAPGRVTPERAAAAALVRDGAVVVRVLSELVGRVGVLDAPVRVAGERAEDAAPGRVAELVVDPVRDGGVTPGFVPAVRLAVGLG